MSGRIDELKQELRNAERIAIADNNTSLFVNKDTGEFVGPTAEGTMGIILFAGSLENILVSGPNSAEAIKIPRLLNLDELLNFHIAEISYHEGKQAQAVSGLVGLEGAKSYFRASRPNYHATIPDGDGKPCYVGFYLSPNSNYRLALVSETQAWPKDFSDYLSSLDYQPEDLFEQIGIYVNEEDKRVKQTGSWTLESLLYLPDIRDSSSNNDGENATTDDSASKRVSHLRSLGRSRIESSYIRKDIGGWWFNLPVGLFSWMTSDLERLITGLLDHESSEDEATDTKLLSSWGPSRWIEMLHNLAIGLGGLHSKGLIHGDSRPANIMAMLPETDDLLPQQFRWIDVGLGYGHSSRHSLPFDDIEQQAISIPPPPLGGGRVTPFYAPERVESVEFEDADLVRLEPLEDDQYKLEFFWKERTYDDPQKLRLKENNKPLRELGKLQKGDRFQLREFIFDVESVENEHIIVSNIYELVMDKVLIRHQGSANQAIIEKLREVAISRYRIFQQWSQATDIYGLGILTLYVFFMRGLYITGIEAKRQKKDNSDDSSTIEKSTREKIFQELSSLLHSQSFLNVVIQTLSKEYKGKGQIWRKEILSPELDADGKVIDNESNHDALQIQQLAGQILLMDQNFRLVLAGANNNTGLFFLLIYFCLSCLWRRDEVRELLGETNFKFEPYCNSRTMIADMELSGGPAKAAREDLDDLQRLIQAAGIENKISKLAELSSPESEFSDFSSRNDQAFIAIMTAGELKKKNDEYKKKIEQLEYATEKLRLEWYQTELMHREKEEHTKGQYDKKYKEFSDEINQRIAQHERLTKENQELQERLEKVPRLFRR